MTFETVFTITILTFTGVYGIIITAFTFSLFRIREGFRQHPSRSASVPDNSLSPLHHGFISVIIPVRNEAKHILRILEEMRLQDFPPGNLEIILSDDFSEDATVELIDEYLRKHPEFPLVLVLSEPSKPCEAGKKRAIERAVIKAKGDILLFTDADTFHSAGWVSAMVINFSHQKVQMVLGPVVDCNESNLLQRFQSLEFLGLMASTAGSACLGYPVMCNGANLAYRRSAFFITGGFSSNLKFQSGDDQFMMASIRRHFGPDAILFNFSEQAIVGTVPESTVHGFIQQRLRWVSKSRGYTDIAVLITGMATYMVHFLVLTGLIMGIFNPWFFILSMLVWIVKITIEYPMIWFMMRFFRKQEMQGYYFIAQVFQLVYVPFAGLMGLFLPYKWKGRKGMR